MFVVVCWSMRVIFFFVFCLFGVFLFVRCPFFVVAVRCLFFVVVSHVLFFVRHCLFVDYRLLI